MGGRGGKGGERRGEEAGGEQGEWGKGEGKREKWGRVGGG